MRYKDYMPFQCKNIAADSDLLALLVNYVAEMTGNNAADTVVFLPSRRACQRFASLWQAPILPAIMPLGEWDEAWLYKQALTLGADATESLLSIPGQADELHYQLQLADTLYEHQAELLSRRTTLEQLLPMAQSIWGVYEQLEREGQPIERLLQLDAQFLSEQWRERVGVMQFATRWWIRQRKEKQVTTLADRRNQLASWLALQWSQRSPSTPVIIAGSTGSQASTVTLMRSASTLPNAEIWLPAWDDCLTEEGVLPNHPNYPLQLLLERLSLEPRHIESSSSSNNTLQQAFHTYQPQPLPDHITRIDVRDEQEEAELISVLVREALEDPRANVAIVTNDATRIRSVQSTLLKYDVVADSAIGQPAMHEPSIQLWGLLLELLNRPKQAVSWLALMKHPLCMSQHDGWADLVERLEYKHLRGYAADSNLLLQMRYAIERLELTEHQRAAWQCFDDAVSPWVEQSRIASLNAAERFQTQLTCWEMMQSAITPSARDMIHRLKGLFAHFRPLDPTSYTQLNHYVLEQQKYFPTTLTDSRVMIYSPIEARLMRATRIILSGLNEGEWPATNVNDAWLHPLMSSSMGLTEPDSVIGLSAHDFVALSSSADEVFWVRAQRVGGAEQLPSRWLERFDVSSQQAVQQEWIRSLDMEEVPLNIGSPVAMPPPSAFPSRLSVSAIEQLLRDPYGFYAKYILGLRTLDLLDQPPDAALRGQIVHRVMEQWNDAVNDGAEIHRDHFISVAKQVIEQEPSLLIRLHWAPRILAMADALIAEERNRRPSMHVVSEVTKRMTLDDLEIHGRIDRLEMSEQSACIIDYKTGAPPTAKEVEQGFAPQLPLLALMVQQQEGTCVGELAYWQLAAVANPLRVKPIKSDPSTLMAFYESGLKSLVTYYTSQEARYHTIPQPAMKLFWNDYAHLSREKQWLSDTA